MEIPTLVLHQVDRMTYLALAGDDGIVLVVEIGNLCCLL